MSFPEQNSEWIEAGTGRVIIVNTILGEGGHPRDIQVGFFWRNEVVYGHLAPDTIFIHAFYRRFKPYVESTPTRFDRIADCTVEDEADMTDIIAKVGRV